MKKLITMVGILLAMGSAQADIWLDGQLTDAELFDYNEEVSLGYDMNGLYEFGGDYFDTMVDTAININRQVLFTDGRDTTYYTSTGAETVYQARSGSTLADVINFYVAEENKDIGFAAKVLRGTNWSGQSFEYRQLKNGLYRSTTEIENDVFAQKGDRTEAELASVLASGTKFELVWKDGRFAKDRGWQIPTEWVGITEAKLYELNKDKFEFTVERGMNKGQIAAAMGITMKELYDANPGLKGRYMTIGEVLKTGKTNFEQGDHIIVKDWDSAETSGKYYIRDRDTFGKAIFADAPTTATSKQVGYVVQSGNDKGTVMHALGVSKSVLNSSNEDFEFNYLKAGQLVVSGAVYFNDGLIDGFIPVQVKQPTNQNMGVAADTQRYVYKIVSDTTGKQANAWEMISDFF